MAPRQRDTPPAPGLLASAFSFVTREIESFVTAAAGGEVQPKQPHQEDQPEASSSRVTLDGKRRARDEAKGDREKERRVKRVRKRSEVESERARAKRRVRREDGDGSDDERDRALRALKKKVQPAPRSRSSERAAADDEDDEPALPPPPKKSTKKRREIVEDAGRVADVANVLVQPEVPPPKKKSEKIADKFSEPMPPPPTPMRPPPSPAALLITPAPTMPGSLFPRSASLMPETLPRKHQRTFPRLRTPTPPPIEPIVEEGEPETAQSDHEESPQRGRKQITRPEQARDRSADLAGPFSVRESSRHSGASGRDTSSSRRSLEEPAEPVPRPRPSKGKERACDTSGEVRVRGKERELREAQEEHERHARDRGDGERDHDKQRIRMLEEEVARLRAELASKNSSSMMPPPPPPPPPPPMFRSQAPTASSGETGNFLASARASLKRTDPPVEAPINSVAYGARTKKTGQPTVNVPSDKMAAFLREMKTVRLRRVGGLTGNTSMGPPASTAAGAGGEIDELNRSTIGSRMSSARMAATLGERSFDLGVAASLELGAKRKRGSNAAGPSKRRETTRQVDTRPLASSSQSLPSSSQSSASSANSSFASSSGWTSSSRTSFVEVVPPRTQLSRPKTSAPLRIWPTASAADTDLTTPSLCSDNENDQEHDDKLPDTPSDSGRNRTEEKSAAPPERVPKLEPAHEVIDVDAIETPAKPQPGPKSAGADRRDLFARRPPASPLPASAKSPDKPKPPARAAKSKIPLALPRRVPVVDEGSESDDPLAAPPSRSESRGRSYVARDDAPRAGPSRVRRDLESSPSPPARSQSRAGGGDAPPEARMTNHARRRLTLDDELRRAGDTLWQPSDEEDGDGAGAREDSEPDVDSGELVAMGTRNSKQGFLARGGGAGAPVFMGEGYVQGATAVEWLATRGGRSRNGTGESGSRRGGAKR